MNCRDIPDDDSLFRHSIFPLSFKQRKLFSADKFVNLTTDQRDGSLLTSLAWERYVPTIARVHNYGCRVAFGINQKKREKSKYNKDKDRHYYCGAYQLKSKKIRALSAIEGLNEVLSADVIHHIENGEIAHADLRIVLKPGSEFNVEGTKTAIAERLWNVCTGPLKHTCDCDKDIQDHQSSGLITPPAGAYFDTRSYFVLVLCIIRCLICKCLINLKKTRQPTS